MRSHTAIVIALALVASLVTGSALAESPSPGSEDALTSKLPLRPNTKLALEPTSSGTSAGWKLMAVVVLAGAGVWAWKRKAVKPQLDERGQLRVVRRTTIGVRSELLLVEIEGQKVLIGVTPSSMQTLYLLPEGAQEESLAEPEPDRRIANLLEARIAPREPLRPASRETALTPADDSLYEGQAAGLRAIGGRR